MPRNPYYPPVLLPPDPGPSTTPNQPIPTFPPLTPPINPAPTPPPTPTPNPTPPPPSPQNPTGRFLINSFDKTDLDIENPLPNGGIPYSQTKDPTVYPITSTRTGPTRGFFAAGAAPASKFYQSWHPVRTYIDFMRDYI